MKSGLVGRNNRSSRPPPTCPCIARLNEVRPSRPEQYRERFVKGNPVSSLNEVRPSRPEQSWTKAGMATYAQQSQ